MATKKSTRFDTHGDQERVAWGGESTAPSRKTDLEKEVAAAVVRFCSSFLRECAPAGWTSRQVNIAIFQRPSAAEKLGTKEPLDGLNKLASRKSIPLLTKGQILSDGLVAAELEPRFHGTLQTLYHPYVDLLTPRESLAQVISLLAMCRYAQTSSLFAWIKATPMRTRQSACLERDELRAAIKQAKANGTWRFSFLDFLAVALGLLQEAVLSMDATGVGVWKSLLLSEDLSFSDWPHASEAACREMQGLVHHLAASAWTTRFDLPQAVMNHLMGRVIDLRNAKPGEAPISFDAAASLYLTIRDGRPPDAEQIAQATSLAVFRFRSIARSSARHAIKRYRKRK